jgi:hypothetical protein
MDSPNAGVPMPERWERKPKPKDRELEINLPSVQRWIAASKSRLWPFLAARSDGIAPGDGLRQRMDRARR